MTRDYLAHHGILGMKWGVRRFQNESGKLTAAGRKRYNEANEKADTIRSDYRKGKRVKRKGEKTVVRAEEIGADSKRLAGETYDRSREVWRKVKTAGLVAGAAAAGYGAAGLMRKARRTNTYEEVSKAAKRGEFNDDISRASQYAWANKYGLYNKAQNTVRKALGLPYEKAIDAYKNVKKAGVDPADIYRQISAGRIRKALHTARQFAGENQDALFYAANNVHRVLSKQPYYKRAMSMAYTAIDRTGFDLTTGERIARAVLQDFSITEDDDEY